MARWSLTLAVRFWSKVERRGPNECWTWLGGKMAKGYGYFGIGRSGYVRAHRQAWELTHGPIPEGMCVLHRCDNPPCCNPAHLFIGTTADNNADMVAKGRQVHRNKYGVVTNGQPRPGVLNLNGAAS